MTDGAPGVGMETHASVHGRTMDQPTLERSMGYVSGLFAPEDDVLRDLRRAIPEAGLPEIFVSPAEGRLLQVLLGAVGARRVVEVGTLGGYSAIWIGRSLPADGRLVTIERNPDAAALARDFIERSGLKDRVEVREGEGLTVLEDLAAAAPWDAIFIDADKVGYPRYLDWALDHVRPGGVILGDNALWSGRVADPDDRDDSTEAIREFNRRLAEDPRLTSVIIPVRDGLAVAIIGEA